MRTHHCDSWQISSYRNELENYRNEIEEYIRQLRNFVNEANYFANEAASFANCELKNLELMAEESALPSVFGLQISRVKTERDSEKKFCHGSVGDNFFERTHDHPKERF